MTARTVAATAAAHVLCAGVCSAILHALGKDDDLLLAFILADILASQAAALAHHRAHARLASAGVKAQVGLLLAGLSLVEGIALQGATGWIVHPDVTIPIAAIGAFFFPFGLMDPMGRALIKRDEARKARNP